MQQYWKNSYEYQRILEILRDYWLEEKDELKVRVTMDFMRANEETQRKVIGWFNPNYQKYLPEGIPKLTFVSARDLYIKTPEEFWNEWESWWNEIDLLTKIRNSKEEK